MVLSAAVAAKNKGGVLFYTHPLGLNKSSNFFSNNNNPVPQGGQGENKKQEQFKRTRPTKIQRIFIQQILKCNTLSVKVYREEKMQRFKNHQKKSQ